MWPGTIGFPVLVLALQRDYVGAHAKIQLPDVKPGAKFEWTSDRFLYLLDGFTIHASEKWFASMEELDF